MLVERILWRTILEVPGAEKTRTTARKEPKPVGDVEETSKRVFTLIDLCPQ